MPNLRTAFVYDRRKYKDKNKRLPVELRIFCRGYAYVQSSFTILPKHWSTTRNAVTNRPDAPVLNLELQKMERAAMQAHIELGPKATAKLIRKALTEPTPDNGVLAKFKEYYRRRADRLAQGTLKQERTLFSYLRKFDPDLAFSDLKYRWVVAFKEWLGNQPLQRGSGTLSPNYVNSLLAILRAYCTEAVKEDLIPNNPVKLMRLEKEYTPPVFLSYGEFKSFAEVEAVGDIQQRTKDMFLFACCTSLRVSDLFDLRKTDIHEKADGLHLFKVPKKTGKRSAGRYQIPIDVVFEGLPGRIYRKYAETTGPYLFPRMDQKSYRSHIKILARSAGIAKDVKTHVARHTFAVTLRNVYEWSIEDISEAMAHTDIKTTQRYSRILYPRIVSIAKRKAQ